MATPETATILIVEDDAGVALLQSLQLKRMGHTVLVATTVEEAHQHVRKGDIDLAVLDYCLPGGVTGLELFQQFKTAGFDLPVIIVTGFSEESKVTEALRAGVRDFVAKTTTYLEYLPEAVARVLKQISTETKLAESEARFQSFMHNSPVLAFIKDEQGRMFYANRLVEDLFQLTDWHGKTVFDLFPQDVAARIHARDLAVLSTGGTTEVVETVPLPDGTPRDLLAHRFPIHDASERRLLGTVAVDITERRRAEEALRNSEAKFRAVSESATDAIISTDQYGHVTSWNKGACGIFGYTPEEILGRSIADLMPPRYHPAQRETFARILARGEQALRGVPMELHGLRKGGSEFPLELSVGTWKHAGELFFSGIIRDTTERKRAEEALRQRDEQLRQSQKMEALGTLAGGVAHEFNNLLQGVQGYTYYAMEGLEPTDRRYQDLELVLEAADRAATLTKQLLGFGRRQMLQISDLDPNQLIRDLVRMLRPLIGEHIRLDLVLSDGVGTVHADLSHLQQLLMNLCVNARDAMPSGGKLTIKTEDLMLDQAACASHPDMTPGRYLVLTVSDTGCGMSSEVLKHAFEPFFTTKEIGKGTGLGLATAYGVVSQHKGTIRVDSEPGLGTTFKIYLPTVEQVAECVCAPQGALRPVPRSRKGESILIAEDEPLVRNLTVRTLENAGYRTLIAKDGVEALAIFEADQDKISLALLDDMMPRMSGREVYGRVRLVRPDMPAIFCSAYDLETAQLGFTSQRGLRFLQKPFDPATLLQMVREVLDHEPMTAAPLDSKGLLRSMPASAGARISHPTVAR